MQIPGGYGVMKDYPVKYNWLLSPEICYERKHKENEGFMESTIIYESNEGICSLTLNRSKVFNALNLQLVQETKNL